MPQNHCRHKPLFPFFCITSPPKNGLPCSHFFSLEPWSPNCCYTSIGSNIKIACILSLYRPVLHLFIRPRYPETILPQMGTVDFYILTNSLLSTINAPKKTMTNHIIKKIGNKNNSFKSISNPDRYINMLSMIKYLSATASIAIITAS